MIHRFGDVEIDTDQHEVRRSGEIIPIEPQVFGVLACLVAGRDRVVTKDELLDEVWGSRFISDSAVTSRIKSARQAVGDSGRTQHVIRTVHGRGYRFVAELDNGQVATTARIASATPRSPDGPTGTRNFDEGWPLVARDAELDAVLTIAAGDTSHGVIVTGPAGLGKTRLARAVIETLEQRGAPVARIHGHTNAAAVPLAAMAHLLPDDIVESQGLRGDLARAALFTRSRDAIRALAGGARLVLMVDDVERIDQLSLALLGSLVAGGDVFAVMTQRVEADEAITLQHLVRSGEIEQVRLGRLRRHELIALLGTVLDGPVQPRTAAALADAADGSPGLLRQILEASRASNALTHIDGLWVLRGNLSAPRDLTDAIDRRIADLDGAHRDALELLTVAGDLDLDLAFDLIGDEVLDQLELDGMITVRQVGAVARVRTAHPLFGELLSQAITPLRARRVRQRLAEALEALPHLDAADRLLLARLRFVDGGHLDDATLMDGAGLAIVQGDLGLAIQLVDRIAPERRTARGNYLRGEALWLSGRSEEAGATLTAIDVDDLDPLSGAHVIRRIATFLYYGRWDHRAALAHLDANVERFDGEARLALESYWVMLAALDGRHSGAVLELGERILSETAGEARSDTLCGLAMAHFTRAEFRRALGRIGEFHEHRRSLERSLIYTGPDYGVFLEVVTHLQLGDATAAWNALDAVRTADSPPEFGFMAVAAGRLTLETGFPQLTIDWLDPHIRLSEALGINTNTWPLRASTALAALDLGDEQRARADADSMHTALAGFDREASGHLSMLDLAWSCHQVDATLGTGTAGIDGLIEAADLAHAVGNRYMEILLLGTAALLGGADRAVDRLAELVDEAEGVVAGLRHRAALAALGMDDPVDVADRFAECGLVREAEAVRAFGPQ